MPGSVGSLQRVNLTTHFPLGQNCPRNITMTAMNMNTIPYTGVPKVEITHR